MEYRASSTVYKKLSNGRSFNDKSAYDGVFSTPSKQGGPVFSARVEDYREIFGASRVSSIPILDVPALNERKFPVDVPSSKLEYSKIFGGFDELNFAVLYDELLAESKRTNSFSDETRTAAGTGRRSPVAEYPTRHEKVNNSSTHETSSQSFDRKEKVSMSFQKFNQKRKNSAKGTTHVAHLHAVPGFTCLIDECTPVQVSGADKPTFEDLNDIPLTNNESKLEIKPELPVSDDNEQRFRSTNPTECQNRSGSVDKLFDAFEGDQGAQSPENPPKCNVQPKFGMNTDFSKGTTDNKSEAFERTKDAGTVYSPPYLEEVDVNSVAAASVAALKKAIDDAQERMKIAKEAMERRKVGPQKRKKFRSSRSLDSEERNEVRTSNHSSVWKEKFSGKTYQKADDPEEAFAEKARDQNSAIACPSTPIVMRENLNAVEANNMEFESRKVDCREEEAEEQFYEPSSLDKDKAKELEYGKEENAEKIVYYANEYEWKGNNGSKETLENSGEGCNRFIVANEADEREENSIRLSVVKNILLSKLKSVLGVTEINSGQNKKETEMKGDTFMEQDKCVKLPEEFQVTEEDVKLAIRDTREYNNMESPIEAQEVMAEEVKDICQQEENEMKQSIVLTEMEKKSDESDEQERNVDSINDFHDDKDENLNENDELEGNKELQENGHNNEMNEGLSINLYNDENGYSIVKEKRIDECAEYNSLMKATPDNLSIGTKLELAGGLCEQHTFYNFLKDQEARTFVGSIEKMEVISNQPELGDTDKKVVPKTPLQAVNNESEAIKEEANMEDKTPFSKENTDASPISDQNQVDVDKINIKLEQKQYETPLNGSSIFCNLGSAEGFARELGEIERNIKEVEGSTDEEDKIDDLREAMPNNVDNSEAGHLPSISEDYRKFEVAEEETITSTISRTDEENPQATMKIKESESNQVPEKEMLLESDWNNIRTDNQSGMIGINHPLEIIPEIRTSQSPKEHEEIHQATVAADEMEAGDSSENEVEQEFQWENQDEANWPGIFRENENLADIDQDIRKIHTSQMVIENENHETTPTLGKIEINVNMQREAEIEFEFNDHKPVQENDGSEELAEILTNESVLEHEATMLKEEKVTNDILDKEAQVQKERQRKTDEAKEKERDRERIAVERAIREARGRAFAEARERAAAERATADTRRRVMAERSGKISAEANDKLTAEKVSVEARLKAQRAAVERATAEARERALEKAMSEKAIFEARNLADKIVAEKLFGTAGDSRMKKHYSFNDSQPKGSCPSNFRNANSFNLGDKDPDHSEREGGSTGESIQRSKARLERHQRTVERVAVALAEKNIRDLLAQREQEERNRMAEALDVEVKRWSSGKEGNLRALLSTLQYILGHDSGWQPVPLTDIITTTAVKKAYRRATLSVHPDKLQQRGASIQQKYICEKVFDLLKAAWNRFNVEER